MANAVVALCLVLSLANLRGRLITHTETWRESARFVDGLAACKGAVLPVVTPPRFGPDTPFFRSLTQRYLFGRYAAPGDDIAPYTLHQFASPPPQLAALLSGRAQGAQACPLLAWAVHDVSEQDVPALRSIVARAAGVAQDRVGVKIFYAYGRRGLRFYPWPEAFVLLRQPASTPDPAPPRPR